MGGRHVFNPSNIGLVLVFLVLGTTLANPQDFWWGRLSVGLVLTYAVIVTGGLLVGSRLRMLGMAVAFWLTFAASIGIVALAGHSMTARWHVGPVTGVTFWWTLVTSPEILVFLFFMITDPRTTPAGRAARVGYGVAVGFLAALLAAPVQSEFATKVAVLGGLAVVCALRPIGERLRRVGPAGRRFHLRGAAEIDAADQPGARLVRSATAVSAAGLAAIVLVVAGIPARPAEPAASAPRAPVGVRPHVELGPRAVPHVTVDPAVQGITTPVGEATAQRMGRDVVEDLVIEARALKALDPRLAATAVAGTRLVTVEDQIAAARRRGRVAVPTYEVEALTVVVKRTTPQSSPQVGMLVRARVHETTYEGPSRSSVVEQRSSKSEQSVLVVEVGGHFLLAS